MDLPNWMTDMTLYHYLAIGGGVVVVLALVLYFTPVSKLKIPSILMSIVGGVGVGLALGVVLMAFFGYRWTREDFSNGSQEPPPGAPQNPPGMARGGGMMGGPPGAGMMGGGGGRGGGGRGGARGGGGGGGGPSPKTQLAALIAKLDVLTKKPLEVKLDAEQKKKIHETIQKLDEKADLSDDEAKAKLDALLEIVKGQRETLEDAGYRWPGQGQGGGNRGGQGNAPANPFQAGANKEHLRSLETQLNEKKTD